MPADRRLNVMKGRTLALVLLLGSAATAHAAPRLDAMFTDNAVLQRDRAVLVSGTADPGERLAVSLAGQSRDVRADGEGRWSVELSPLPAGGPHRLDVTGSGGAKASAANLLIGDVWLCSGQSNMEWPVRQSLNGEAEAQSASDDQVRLISIAQKTALAPRTSFEEQPRWQLLSPESAAEFSAACHFMARGLRESQKVPFGLIDASWGGTRIRPWMDEQSARAVGYVEDADLLALYRRDPGAAARQFAGRWENWWRGQAGTEPWRDSGALQWRPFPSMTYWNEWNGAGLSDFDGLLWARRRFTLTAEEAAKPATLSLGVIDDFDQTWVNGIGIGNSFGWSLERNYTIPAGVLKPGENAIIVNVGDDYGPGGFQGPAEKVRLTYADGQSRPLGDGWEYSVVRQDVGKPPHGPWQSHTGLSTIYNAMIAPLGPLGLRGVAWYQGESDVGIDGYDERLNAMMQVWRRQFRSPQLPFLIVGLAGFGEPGSQPTESGWARLQDEQRQAAQRDSNVALVPALDIGERADIHPPNKQEVGRRLALAARSLVYRDPEGRIAPMPVSARRTPQGIQIDFTGPLQAFSDARPLAFELCGETQPTCRYVDARISGNSVVIANDGRPATRVRYAWSDYAVVNLYSGDLPLPTFEVPIR